MFLKEQINFKEQLLWEFTKKRADVEGRIVPKEAFITALFNSFKNVNRMKKDFGNKIFVVLIKKYQQEIEKSFFISDKLDNYVKIKYKLEELEKILV